MSPEEIRLAIFKLRKKGISLASIGRSVGDTGVTRQAVALVIDRKIVSKRIMAKVADALGKDKRYVFPEYWLKKSA